MSKRMLSAIGVSLLLCACGTNGKTDEKIFTEKNRQQQEVTSELPSGSLKDPGGAKELRQEIHRDQQQQQESLDQIDQQ